MKEKIVVGMAGLGGIGKVHLLAFRDIPLYYPGRLPEVEVRGACLSSEDRSRRAAELWGFPRVYRNYEEMVLDPEITLIDCVSPNYLHREQILRALEAGKDVICEKPLALNGEEAREICRAAEKARRQVGMIFNYRFIPAIRKAGDLIREGRLGRIYGFRGEYLHSGYQDPRRPFSWRLDKSRSGGGALADLGVHVLDLLRFLLGEIETVRAGTETYITERPLPGGGEKTGPPETAPVEVDDAAWLDLSLRDAQGRKARGTLEVTRFGTGTLDDLSVSAWGENGAFRFNLMDANFLYWYDAGNPAAGWQRLETLQKYPGTDFPAPRSIIGWTRFHGENIFRFLEAITEGTPFEPGVRDGLAAQLILDGAYESALRGGERREIPTLI